MSGNAAVDFSPQPTQAVGNSPRLVDLSMLLRPFSAGELTDGTPIAPSESTRGLTNVPSLPVLCSRVTETGTPEREAVYAALELHEDELAGLAIDAALAGVLQLVEGELGREY